MKKNEKLIQLRNGMGYSQDGMARHIGVSLSMYEKVERGDMEPSRNFMKKIKVKFPEESIDTLFFN